MPPRGGKPRRKSKSPNGQGTTASFPTTFDLSDPDEKRAWEMAQQLATPHGRRKRAIMAFLLALDELQMATGMEFNADVLSSTMIAERILGSGAGGGIIRAPQADIVIENVQRVDPREMDRRMAEEAGDLFG